uniref:Uncharacterized protein n=1 Tax=Timema cristinae TaxID=61476 RepID=A0A7R9H2Q4_TIMCR|nr:unnamed protein product [Timema cristinae]
MQVATLVHTAPARMNRPREHCSAFLRCVAERVATGNERSGASERHFFHSRCTCNAAVVVYNTTVKSLREMEINGCKERSPYAFLLAVSEVKKRDGATRGPYTTDKTLRAANGPIALPQVAHRIPVHRHIRDECQLQTQLGRETKKKITWYPPLFYYIL